MTAARAIFEEQYISGNTSPAASPAVPGTDAPTPCT
jgi:hypothetical protein